MLKESKNICGEAKEEFLFLSGVITKDSDFYRKKKIASPNVFERIDL